MEYKFNTKERTKQIIIRTFLMLTNITSWDQIESRCNLQEDMCTSIIWHGSCFCPFIGSLPTQF